MEMGLLKGLIGGWNLWGGEGTRGDGIPPATNVIAIA